MNLMRLEARSNGLMSSIYKTLIRLGRRLQIVCAVLLITLFLSGCGDVRGQGDRGDTLTLAAQGARYLALQDGLGPWQLLSARPDNELVKLTLSDPQGRYGLMSVCLEETSGAIKVNVLHGVIPRESASVAVVTTADSTSAQALPLVTLPCAAQTETLAPLEVQGRVRGLAAGEYGRVYLGDASSLIDAATTEHHLELRSESVPAELDLVAAKYGAGAQLPSVLLLTSTLALSPDQPAQADLDFASAAAISPQAAQLPLAGVRAGELLSGSVELVTKTGTRALLGEFMGAGSLSYARPPEALLRGASLWAEAQSFSYNDRTKAGSSRSASRTFEDGVVAPLVLPPPLQLAAPLLRGGAAQLRPQVVWSAKPNEAGGYTQFYSQIQEGHTVSYRLTQSLAYLRLVSPEASSFSQALPDFSALPEWQTAWNLVRGPELFWDVSWSRKTERDALFSSRSGVLAASAR